MKDVINERIDTDICQNKWKDTVDNMLSVFFEVASDDPHESINRLVKLHCAVEVDPLVSSAAKKLLVDASKEDEEIMRYALSVLENCDASTGYCGCGKKVDAHGPWDDHSPVDEGKYYQDRTIEAIRIRLKKYSGV